MKNSTTHVPSVKAIDTIPLAVLNQGVLKFTIGVSTMKRFSFVMTLAALSFLASCSGVKKEATYPTGADRDGTNQNDIYSEKQGIFGEGGIKLLGGRGEDKGDESGIGVNSYLWRAALDTVAFMPLASADPFGGVILTDWYSPPDNAGERLKLNVFILDKQLRSDGIQVKVFRQIKKGGDWRDAPVAEGTARQLEDAILTRARQMRVAKINGTN
jgi:hypothetical protein